MFSLKNHQDAMLGDFSYGATAHHSGLSFDIPSRSPSSENESSSFSENDFDSLLAVDQSPEHVGSRSSSKRNGMTPDQIAAVLAAEGRRRSRRETDDEDDCRQARRLLTNKRERWRQQMVNDGFQHLRQLIPTFPADKKLSKHDVLRHAARYVVYLQHQLTEALEQRHQQLDPSSARSRALGIRERQDWQFASMFNHLPLNSANAASIMSAAAYGPPGMFSRSYPTPGPSPNEFFPSTAGAEVPSTTSRGFAQGGFPNTSVTATIPTPVLLSGSRETSTQSASLATPTLRTDSDMTMSSRVAVSSVPNSNPKPDDPFHGCWSTPVPANNPSRSAARDVTPQFPSLSTAAALYSTPSLSFSPSCDLYSKLDN